jgi:hypothetical protein
MSCCTLCLKINVARKCVKARVSFQEPVQPDKLKRQLQRKGIPVIYFVTIRHKPLYFRVVSLTCGTFSRSEILDTLISTVGTLLLANMFKRINIKAQNFVHRKTPIANTYRGIYH